MVKLVIYLGIMLILLSSANNISSKSIKDSVQEANLKNQIIFIDSALVSYYRFHSVVPDNINSDFLKQFGIEAFDLSNISYEKKADNEFTLCIKLHNDDYFFSPNSNNKFGP